jgi:hypothetical protein
MKPTSKLAKMGAERKQTIRTVANPPMLQKMPYHAQKKPSK